MIFSKTKSAVVLLQAFLFFSSCRDDGGAGKGPFESTSVVKVHPTPLSPTIDWNCELAILGGEEIRKQVAAATGLATVAIKEAVRIEVQTEEELIQIIAVHDDGEKARQIAQAMADSFIETRREIEIELATKQLEKLDAELEAQTQLVEENTDALTKLIENNGQPLPADDSTLEQDRMTYEKAREALEEEPEKGGVLYQKPKE